MSERLLTDEDSDRLRKLERVEDLARGVNKRWLAAGSLARIEPSVRELLDQLLKLAGRATRSQGRLRGAGGK
jgi:hypothetical protein